MIPLLLATALVAGPARAGFEALPAGALVGLRVADPEEPAAHLTIRTGTPALEASLGTHLGLARYAGGRLAVQLDLSAGISMGFLPGDAFTFGISTLDGRIRVPLTVAVPLGSLTAAWVHHSAHYADGIRYDGQAPPNTDPFSREYLHLVMAREGGVVRPYAGVRQAIHTVPRMPGTALHGGLVVSAEGGAGLYGAADGSWDGRFGWKAEISGEVGHRWRGGASELRLAVAGHLGPAAAAKRSGEEDRWLGVRLAVGLPGRTTGRPEGLPEPRR